MDDGRHSLFRSPLPWSCEARSRESEIGESGGVDAESKRTSMARALTHLVIWFQLGDEGREGECH